MDHPKLRYGLEIIPVEQRGARYMLLRDRLGYSEQSLFLSPSAMPLLTGMDGNHSLRDLQERYLRATGELLFMEKLQAIVSVLDENLFLENDRYIRHVAERIARFRQDPVRRMQHAGKSYPEDPEALRRELDDFFAPERGGPGRPGPRCGTERVLGLVVPHIDMKAGGATFAHAYKAALESPAPETWVILGTGHEPLENGFALTRKDFETPLGIVRTDQDACESLTKCVSMDLLADEYHHRSEHSVEFQTVFLAHLVPQARIVALLCSFGPEEWRKRREDIEAVIRALSSLASARAGSLGFIASVDLAHIGPRYGDAICPDEAVVSLHLRKDRQLLAFLERCDADAFMGAVAREENQRKICGVAPLFVLARVLAGRARGRTLHHASTVVDPHGSFVTFAGMVFHESGGMEDHG